MKNVAQIFGSVPARVSDSIWVACGGVLGTLSRYGLDHILPPHLWLPRFPWPTFVINVSGAALLGFIVAWTEESEHAPSWLRPGVAIGFCGAYTTFSTASVEILLMARDGHAESALAYLVASLGLGVLAVTISTALAVKIFKRAGAPESK